MATPPNDRLKLELTRNEIQAYEDEIKIAIAKAYGIPKHTLEKATTLRDDMLESWPKNTPNPK